MLHVLIDPLAAAVLRDEVAKRKAEYPEAAQRLKDEFIEVRGYIGRFPLLYPIAFDDFHKANLATFPFSVFYVVHLDMVEILAFSHQHTDRDELMKQLRKLSD